MDDSEYFTYLKSRSRVGDFYRKHWLYPRISRHLTGIALDVGCGIGGMLAFRPRTVGVDVNARTVEYCCQRGLDAHLMQPDTLPFQPGTFDSALMDNVLEHIEAPLPLLAEIRRVLKPQGTLIVGVPGRKGFARDLDHKIFYDQPALAACLERAGFSASQFFHMPLDMPWLDQRISQYFLYGVFIAREV